jgi:uncharacterized protein YciI
MVEQHWSYMDRFAATMIARGPTFTRDGTLTGSVHMLGLPGPDEARAFAFDEPGYQAGAYRDVLLRRWKNAVGRTMWEFHGSRAGNNRYLVLGFTLEPAPDATELPLRDEVIVGGPLLSDDGTSGLGTAVLLEAPDADSARDALPADGYVGVECISGGPAVHRPETRP